MSPKYPLKQITDALLRGALCGVWIAAIPVGLVLFLMGVLEEDSGNQSKLFIKSAVCFGVMILALSAHLSLMPKEIEKYDDHRNDGWEE